MLFQLDKHLTPQSFLSKHKPRSQEGNAQLAGLVQTQNTTLELMFEHVG